MVLEIILFMLTDFSFYIYYGTPISDEMRDKIVSPISLLNICFVFCAWNVYSKIVCDLVLVWKQDKMNEILNNWGSLQEERHVGILWSTDDAFAQVMGKEHCGHVRGIGFGPTPTRRNRANLPCLTGPSSSRTAHRMTELENSLMDQLAQPEQRHQEAIVALHA